MDYRTDRARVTGLGSAKEGTGHFVSQRVTAIALIPLTLLFIFPFASALGAPLRDVQEIYSSPFNAIVAVAFIIVSLLHLQYGLQVVIEDYIHGKMLRTLALLGNKLFTWALMIAGVFAIVKLAL